MASILSHPADQGREAVQLWDHVKDVAGRVPLVVPPSMETPFGSPVNDTVSRLAWVHDLGKATTWFQTYLHDDSAAGPTHHSPLGGLAAHAVLEATERSPEECLAGFVAVSRHHGRLPDVGETVFGQTNPRSKRNEQIRAQIENIDEHAPNLAEDIFEEASDGALTWEEFATSVTAGDRLAAIQNLVSHRGTTHTNANITPEFYPTLIQYWSGLVFADKSSAANAPVGGLTCASPSRTPLRDHIVGLESSQGDVPPREAELNDNRSAARSDVLAGVDDLLERNESRATITLPTGMGKTLTGMDAALKIIEETERDRIIYALPFTSIIDQVADELGDLYDVRSDELTVHHHLANTAIEIDDETDLDADIAEMFGESWRSGIIVTTFVQLLESLAGPKNTQSMKLPALYDSVVILDEPQGLPHEWWPLTERLTEILENQYGAVVIAMTATQPRIFEDQPLELVSDVSTYFDVAERTEFYLDPSVQSFPEAETGPRSYDDAASQLCEESGDTLAVCNTIDSAIALTDAVMDQTDAVDAGSVLEEIYEQGKQVDGASLANHISSEGVNDILVHLTTRHRPKDRLLLIDSLSILTDDPTVSVTVVSTQLIEAGVDLSFEQVYRDFAPLDSLVQAAGRCNRSYEQERGRATVWWLEPPEEASLTPAEAVYDRWGTSLLRVTKRVIDDIAPAQTSTLPEPTVAWDGVNEYYRRLSEEKGVGKETAVELLDNGEVEKLGQESLIQSRQAIEVVVTRTPSERELVERLRDAWRSRDYSQTSALLAELRQLQVSIPIYRSDSNEAKKLRHLDVLYADTEIRLVDTDQQRDTSYFDAQTGVVVPETSVERRFL